MNREIKFRAWAGERMHKSFLVARPQFANCLSVMTDESFAKEQYGLNEWKVMQYTGLKDKNGVEIYEGDVMKEVYVPLNSYPKIIEYYNIGVVVWDGRGFGLQLKIDGSTVLNEGEKLSHHRTQRKVYNHPTAGENWVDSSSWFHKMEVIGNIYENPELIKPNPCLTNQKEGR